MGARLRHVAIGTNDPLGMGQFFAEALGLELLVNSEDFSSLSDGTMNIVLCRGEMFQPDSVSRPGYAGIHHIGFLVDSRAEVEQRLAKLDATPAGGADEEPPDGGGDKSFEVKWLSSEGVIFDLSEHGWPTSAE